MYYGGGVHQTADQGCSVAGQSPVARAWTARPIGCMCALSVTQKRHSSYNIAVTIEALHAFALIGSCRYSQLGTTKNPHERRYAATNRKQFLANFPSHDFPPNISRFSRQAATLVYATGSRRVRRGRRKGNRREIPGGGIGSIR